MNTYYIFSLWLFLPLCLSFCVCMDECLGVSFKGKKEIEDEAGEEERKKCIQNLFHFLSVLHSLSLFIWISERRGKNLKYTRRQATLLQLSQHLLMYLVVCFFFGTVFWNDDALSLSHDDNDNPQYCISRRSRNVECGKKS